MKKILAMATVVALTAGATSFAANMDQGLKFSGDVNVKYSRTKVEKEIDNPDPATAAAKPKIKVKETVNPYTIRVRLQADAELSDQVVVSGRVGLSDIFNSDKKADKKVALDRLHVMYKPMDGVMLDLGRTGVELGNDGEFFDNSFDGLVASYAKDSYALEAGYGKVRLVEDGKLYSNVDNLDNVAYVKGAFDVNDQINVGGYFVRSLGDAKVNAYGLNAKAMVAENISVFGDVLRVDAPKDPTAYVIGAQYGQVTNEVGSWHAKLKYGASDLNTEFAALGIALGDASAWQAEAKAAVYKDVTLKASYVFNAKEANKDLENVLGLELNYSF